jgi:hypothetical protein
MKTLAEKILPKFKQLKREEDKEWRLSKNRPPRKPFSRRLAPQ